MALTFTDNLNVGSGDIPPKKEHVSELITAFDSITNAVKFEPEFKPIIDNGSITSVVPKRDSLLDLQTQINILESKFSNNCDCLQNLNCCQTQCTCQSCQQECMTLCTCQSCQRSLDCHCGSD